MRFLTDSCSLFFFLFIPLLFYVIHALAAAGNSADPFSPRAALIRYWNREIQNGIPKSPFLLSKASPLTAVQAAAFSKLASSNSLPDRMPELCAAAKLFCFPDLAPSLEQHSGNSKFEEYFEKNFTNYGNSRTGGFASFKNYSFQISGPDSFRRYSRDSTGRKDSFTSYSDDGNVNGQRFTSYAAGATGGSGKFSDYGANSNVPLHRFTSYASEGNGRSHSFSAYAADGNAGEETFTSYGKNGNAVPNEFTSYGNNTNVNQPSFNNYGESGNGGNDTFKSYGFNGNVPGNNFKNYGTQGNGGVDSFSSYREQSNVGDDSFQSYAKNANNGVSKFTSYGKSFNTGTDKFTGYGLDAQNTKITFAVYGTNNSFSSYSKNSAAFSQYSNVSRSSNLDDIKMAAKKSGKIPNKWAVEPGKFFREAMLKSGTIMPMPDIEDKMPKRSFLPRSISSRLPFSTSKIGEIKEIFHAANESAMESIILDALRDCERAPSAGETKRCASSAEELIDFATSMLGRNIAVRTTRNTRGSKGEILIGEVRGINGGEVTKSVSCHQSLYPYLLYYCHSVPEVRVYEAGILDPKSKEEINHGVAICHLDTSSWSRNHGAFVALGDGPGRIEVCHWIFENDMTWTVAD